MPENVTENSRDRKIVSMSEREFFDFFAGLDNEEIDYKIKCYRVSKEGNKQYKKYLRSYIGQVPDEDEIGDEYGGGHFWLCSLAPDGRTLERHLWVDDIWTNKLNEKNRSRMHAAVPLGQVGPDPIEYFKTVMVDIVKPIIDLQNKTGVKSDSNNSVDAFGKIMDGITEGMVKNLNRIQASVVTRALENMNNSQPAAGAMDADASSGENTSDRLKQVQEIVQGALEFAKQFGKNFLNAEGPKKTLFEKIIQNDEGFKKAQADPAIASAIYQAACDDPDIGRKSADALFTKLGFEIQNQTQEEG